MTIRLIARELYAIMREIDELEKAAAGAEGRQKEALLDRLRKLRAENHRVRNALEGRKDAPPSRRGFNS